MTLAWTARAIGALLGALVGALALGGLARAADLPRAPDAAGDGQTLWVVTVTGKMQATPRSPGSSEYTAFAYPTVSYREAGAPQPFSAPDDGISFSLFDTSNVQLGATARFVPGRQFSDDPHHLYGLREIGFAVEPGAYVEYYPVTWLRARGELRQGFLGHHGLVGTVGLDLIQPVGSFQVSVGPRFNFGDAAFARRYFGVTPAEALANGSLTPFTPDSYATAGGLAAVTYTFSDRWAGTAYVGYNRIVGSSAESPLVRRDVGTPNQFLFGVKLGYSFTMPALF